MVRAALHDDLPGPGCEPVVPMRQTGLDDDVIVGTLVNTEVHPTITVRQRSRTGFDDDGNATFEWVTVVTGTAVVWEMRSVWDSDTGLTVVKGTATVLYDGDAVVTETALVEETDRQYRVRQVGQVPGVLTLALERLSDG